MNALDNRVARNHVNRMCLAANVPLVETGTAGYAGQVNENFTKQSKSFKLKSKERATKIFRAQTSARFSTCLP